MKRLLFLLMLILGLGTMAVQASDLYPDIPKATGKPHPEGNEYMRINHMNMLKHDRDRVVREGIRNKDNTLAQCITCHAVKGEDNKPVTYESEKYFCRTCHDYVAVKLDCFSCHNSLPEEPSISSLFKRSDSSYEILLSYLEGTDDD